MAISLKSRRCWLYLILVLVPSTASADGNGYTWSGTPTAIQAGATSVTANADFTWDGAEVPDTGSVEIEVVSGYSGAWLRNTNSPLVFSASGGSGSFSGWQWLFPGGLPQGAVIKITWKLIKVTSGGDVILDTHTKTLTVQ